MAITDLTGYTWVGNDVLISAGTPPYEFEYSLNFTDDVDSVTFTTLLIFDSGFGMFLNYSDGVYGYNAYNGEDYIWQNGRKTIQITGGDDATNSALIAWLQANGTLTAPTPRVTCDLTTLDGWESLSDGDHVITVKAKATGYRDSEASEGVTVTKQAQPVGGNYLTFESDDGSEFTLSTDSNEYDGDYVFGSDGTFEYSTDTTNWNTWLPSMSLTSVNGKLYLRGSGNTYLATYHSCFLFGTKITLADGTAKNVEDLTYDDELKVWDFEKGEYSTAPICWLTRTNLKNYQYYQLTFDDGTVLKTTGTRSIHRVYNVDERRFKAVSETEVGDRVFSEHGILTVDKIERIDREVRYMNLMTSKTIDCFANGILTSDRYGNLYQISEDMKWIKDDRPIRPLSEFTEAGISEYWYEPLRLSEQTDDLESIVDYIRKCESQMQSISEGGN